MAGVSERELELVQEVVAAKIDTVNARMDGIEKWVKWGALGIATNALGVAIVAVTFAMTGRAPAPARTAIEVIRGLF